MQQLTLARLKRTTCYDLSYSLQGEAAKERNDGADDKDYISRQASLSLKGNGVYTVQGTESKGKLMWKFEYVVDNRRAPSGYDIPGEKVRDSSDQDLYPRLTNNPYFSDISTSLVLLLSPFA